MKILLKEKHHFICSTPAPVFFSCNDRAGRINPDSLCNPMPKFHSNTAQMRWKTGIMFAEKATAQVVA